MTLSEIIRYTMETTNTTARICAAELGISPQNFGQRLRRDGFDLEETRVILDACGAHLEMCVVVGDTRFNV